MADVLDLGDGLTAQPSPQQPSSAAPAKERTDVLDLGDGVNPKAPAAETWAQYAGNPQHPMLNRVGSAIVEEGKRAGAGLLGAAKSAISGDWFSDLAHNAGRETAQNVATPDTAGKSLNVAMALTPGDLMTGESLGAKMARRAPAKPTADELYDAAGKQYDAVRNANVYYTEGGLQDLVGGAKDALNASGLHDVVAPKTHTILDRLSDPRGSYERQFGEIPPDTNIAPPLSWVENHRRVLSQIAGGSDPTERAAASTALSHVNDFLHGPPPDAVFSGDAKAAGDLYRTANGNYASAKRSDLLQGIEEGADFQSGAANSGRNFDNVLRQRLRPYLDPSVKSKNLRGFSPDEVKAVSKVVEGGPLRNTTRVASNMLGGGGGWGSATEALMSAALGHELMGPAGITAGVVVPATGYGLKVAQNAMAKRALNRADELVRSRNPLYREREAASPLELQANAPGIAAVRSIGPTNSNNIDNDLGYAKGGAVKGKPTHEFLVARLMKLAEEAKRAEKASTKPILDVPDSTVAKALAKAQEAI